METFEQQTFQDLEDGLQFLVLARPVSRHLLPGKRGGNKDNRWLWDAVLDVVERVRSAWCIFENPDGILSLGEFAGVLIRLETLGYSFRAFRVPVSALGAGHQRYRVFTVAHAHANSAERWSGEPGGNLFDRQTTGRQQSSDGLGEHGQAGIESDATCKLQYRRGDTRKRWGNEFADGGSTLPSDHTTSKTEC